MSAKGRDNLKIYDPGVRNSAISDTYLSLVRGIRVALGVFFEDEIGVREGIQ